MSRLWTTRLVLLLLIALLLPISLVAAQDDDLNVVINTITADPIPNEPAYQVTAYVTVTDGGGSPYLDLTPDDFEASQDGQAVDLESAALTERPISVMLVIDTSGSMAAEGKIEAVKQAATAFVDGLNAADQVGLIHFNDEVNLAQPLSSEHQPTFSLIDFLEAEDGSGTCLYDAAYEAIDAVSAAPASQRAVILLTDGIDELPDQAGPCSEYNAAEVIDQANQRGTRTPIYTIGVGQRIDADELRRMADKTGGTAYFGGADTIPALFQTISLHLKSQYALSYRTQTTVGEHTLTVTASKGGTSQVATRTFIAPELPPVLSLTGLDDDALLDGTQTVRATVSGRGEITSVRFSVDGESLAEVDSAPFEVTLNSEDFEAGFYTVEAVATLADGTELGTSLDFEVEAQLISSEGESGEESAAPNDSAGTSSGEADTGSGATVPTSSGIPGWLIAVVVMVLVAMGGGMAFLTTRRNPRTPKGTIVGGGVNKDYTGKKTLPGARASLGETAFGTLHVEESLSLNRGQKFELHGDTVRIGRGADNDVIIPDAPVSRHHAEIRQMADGTRRLFDLGSSYGSFVNEDRCSYDGLPIDNGDNLQFGTRTITRFEAAFAPHIAGAEDATMDIGGTELELEAEHATRSMPSDDLVIDPTLIEKEEDNGDTLSINSSHDVGTLHCSSGEADDGSETRPIPSDQLPGEAAYRDQTPDDLETQIVEEDDGWNDTLVVDDDDTQRDDDDDSTQTM